METIKLITLKRLETFKNWVVSTFVQKEQGKSLSTNDYTDAAKSKVDAIPDNPKYTDTTYDLSKYEKIENKDVAGGYLGLDAQGKVNPALLPKITYTTMSDLPTVGKENVIYIVSDTNSIYRWDGATYQKLADTTKLGESSDTAYRGDRGKIAYEHTLSKGNPHGLTKEDIAALGVKITDTDTTYDLASSLSDGLMSKEMYKKVLESESKAQENKIETIKRNGILINPVDKSIDIKVPTSISELTNDINLVNEARLKQAIDEFSDLLYVPVDSLPAEGEKGKIYVTPSTMKGNNNVSTEYYWDNNTWEKFGEVTSSIDLSGHWSKQELTIATEEDIANILTL